MLVADPISYARNRMIKNGIDQTIQQLVFGGMETSGKRKNISVEIDKLITDVCDELNLISGETITIELSKCKLIPNTDGMVYYIPPEVRKNRDVRIAISVDYNTPMSGYSAMAMYNSGGGILNTALTDLSRSLNTSIGEASTEVYLEDTNTIKIVGNNAINQGRYTRATVEIENRNRLNNLPKGSYPTFYTIAIAYVKSYIYNNRVKIDKASLYGGHELTSITNVIDSYSGAEQEYNEYLSTTAPKMMMFADKSKLNSLYRDMT